jgi:hypothetical protein
MGQYYYPILLDKDGKILAWMVAYEYGNGLKLTEHSYLENKFVQAFEFLLAPDQQYHKTRVVWAGDYADVEPNSEEQNFIKVIELCSRPPQKNPVVCEESENKNLYYMCEETEKIHPEYLYSTAQYPYIVNHTKKQFVDKRKNIDTRNGALGLHPLPLLTCEGNGRGGGDYHGESPLIGLWARDVISIEKNKPLDCVEIVFDLKEQL